MRTINKRLRYLEGYIFRKVIDEGFACAAQIASLYHTNLLFYLNVLNIYSFIKLEHCYVILELDISCVSDVKFLCILL